MVAKRSTLSIVFLLMVLSSEIHADENPMEVITVTANKIEENVQNVPGSITVIDGEMIEEKGIKNLNDLIKEIPNLYSAPAVANNETENFRGLNTSKFTRNNPVVIYVDGVPQSNSYGYDALLVNVERIEVVKGPQGTLYGKDAIGGVINIITRKHLDHADGFVSAEYGTNNYMEGKLALSAPIVKEKLFLGLNAKVNKDDGWITNHHKGMDKDANSKKEHRFGGRLLYEPTDRLNMRFSMGYEYLKKNWYDGIYIDPARDIRTVERKEAENTNFDVDSANSTDANFQALNVKFSFDKINFVSITTHKKLNIESEVDYDYGNNPAFDKASMFQNASFDTTSQELRVSTTSTNGIRWVGGLYAEREKNKNPRFGQTFYMPDFYAMYTQSTLTSDTAAIFGQAIIPFADRFELTIGGRYQHLKRDLDAKTWMHPVGGSASIPAYLLDTDHSWEAFLPKVAMLYKLNDTFSTFTTISRGYMPGGYNLLIMDNNEENSRFEPEKSINYEIGIKKKFRLGYLDLSLFYMDIKDVHTYKFINGNIPVTSNIPKAHSYGAEMEFAWFLSSNWAVDGMFGLLRTEYDEHVNNALNGNKIENSPSYSARLGISYNHPSGFYGRFDTRSRGDIYFNDANTLKEDSYILADIRAGYKFKAWDFYAFMNNITDKDYIDTASAGEIKNHVLFGKGRAMFVGIKYSW